MESQQYKRIVCVCCLVSVHLGSVSDYCTRIHSAQLATGNIEIRSTI